MAIKLTTSIAKQEAANRGFILKSDYTTNNVPMEFMCSRNHSLVKSWNNFRISSCGQCIREDKNILLYQEAKNIIENSNGSIVSENYIDANSQMSFVCCCGKIGNLTLIELRSSNGFCPNCRYERSAQELKHDMGEIIKMYSDNGCTLLSKEYSNKNDSLDYICICGEKESKVYSAFMKSPFCKNCISNNKKLTRLKPFNYYENLYTSNECEILNIIGEYKGQETLVNFKCKCGESHISPIKIFRNSPQCPECGEKERLRKSTFSIDYIRDYIESNSECKLISNKYVKSTELLEFKCICGDKFTTTFSNFTHENKRQCNGCGISTRSGENSPFWKNGATSETEKIRHSIEYKDWRIQVFTRDNFTCQCCFDSSGGNLQAHHIENFSTNEDLRFEIDNGKTMCFDCHDFRVFGSYHHMYGTRNNNRKQLEEYIEQKRLALNI